MLADYHCIKTLLAQTSVTLKFCLNQSLGYFHKYFCKRFFGIVTLHVLKFAEYGDGGLRSKENMHNLKVFIEHIHKISNSQEIS